MEPHVTATECDLPYGITPATRHNEHTLARQAGTQFIYLRGMQGWVDLGDLLHSEMIYQPADGRPSGPSVD